MSSTTATPFDNGSSAEHSRPSGPPRISLVVPCYNEEPVLAETCARVSALLGQLTRDNRIASYSVYFIDDGSTDRTWDLIQDLAASESSIHGIKLSRNFGQQSAILAGLMTAPGDAVISIDADLQDHLDSIAEMLDAYAGGAEIVYGIRKDRGTDGIFKRSSAETYYRLLHVLGVKLVFNHADFRLLSRRVVEALRAFKETNLFLRGLIPQLGFRSALVYYDRQARTAGETKYPLGKMISLAINGIVSFTDVPLKAITVLGLLVSLFSFGMAAWALAVRFFDPAAVPGWASTVIPLYFLGRYPASLPGGDRAISSEAVCRGKSAAAVHHREDHLTTFPDEQTTCGWAKSLVQQPQKRVAFSERRNVDLQVGELAKSATRRSPDSRKVTNVACLKRILGACGAWQIPAEIPPSAMAEPSVIVSSKFSSCRCSLRMHFRSMAACRI